MLTQTQRFKIAELQSPSAGPFADRLHRISGQLLDMDYRNCEVGDGADAEIDPRPILNFEAFDCQTFVEVVLALALTPAGDPGAVMAELLALRYRRQPPNWFARNHHFLAEWLTHNEARGVLRDVSGGAVPGNALARLRATCDRRAWHQRQADGEAEMSGLTSRGRRLLQQWLAAHPGHPEPMELDLTYIPFAKLLTRKEGGPVRPRPELDRRLAHGQLVVFVAAGRPAHAGFVFRDERGWCLRHATVLKKRVYHQGFVNYLAYLSTCTSFVGLKLYEVAPA